MAAIALKQLLSRRAVDPAVGIKPHTAAEERLEQIKDAHWELAGNEASYRQLLDTQDDLIVRRRCSGELVFVNRAYCLAFGVTGNTVLASRFMPVVLVAETQRADGASAGQSPRRTVEFVETTRGPRWIAWEEHHVTTGDGDVEIQCVGRDVTEQRHSDAVLREARDQAESANRAKSRFLAAMSHEIRTPMNGILGMASLLRDTELTSDQDDYTRAIDQSARALLALIDEILDFSKIEAGKLQLASKPFSLRVCVASALELLAPCASDKGLDLTWSIAPNVPEFVLGDAARVRQILLNLLSNAVKFTEKGSIDVAVTVLNSGLMSSAPPPIVIMVKDTGIGFSTDTMKRLFDEFEQAEPAPGRGEGGTGLGLSISKRLARAMGGDITAEGGLGTGATFTAILHLAGTLESVGETPERLNGSRVSGHEFSPPPHFVAAKLNVKNPFVKRAGGLGPRVLIAEDNEINALLARRVIEMAQGCAIVVGNGRAAIDAVAQSLLPGATTFDLILMDVFMPEVDGLEATKAIKKLFEAHTEPGFTSPPIVALTANAFAEDKERCLAAGMNDFLAKPFDTRHLRDLLVRWVPACAVAVSQAGPKPAA